MVWQFQDILLETYRYAPGKAEVNPPHSHAEYQLCLSLDFPGNYNYRGANHPVPQRSLSILHPGEMHASYDPHDREEQSNFRLFYLPSHLLQDILSRDNDRLTASPFFPDPILVSENLFQSFLRLHNLLGDTAPLLEQEGQLYMLLQELTLQHAKDSPHITATPQERTVVRYMQEYIQDHYDRNISLADLAKNLGRHPVYLHQMFRQAVGLPPHAYLIQIRIDRAKRLLAQGLPISTVARDVGFYDQSHFGKYFRRYTGVTPARYRTLKMS